MSALPGGLYPHEVSDAGARTARTIRAAKDRALELDRVRSLGTCVDCGDQTTRGLFCETCRRVKRSVVPSPGPTDAPAPEVAGGTGRGQDNPATADTTSPLGEPVPEPVGTTWEQRIAARRTREAIS